MYTLLPGHCQYFTVFHLELCKTLNTLFLFFFFFISWRLITLQYCSGFCHTLKWISHGFTCVPPPDPTRSLWVFPVHQVRALVSCIEELVFRCDVSFLGKLGNRVDRICVLMHERRKSETKMSRFLGWGIKGAMVGDLGRGRRVGCCRCGQRGDVLLGTLRWCWLLYISLSITILNTSLTLLSVL